MISKILKKEAEEEWEEQDKKHVEEEKEITIPVPSNDLLSNISPVLDSMKK